MSATTMSLTIAETRVDGLHTALTELVRAESRLKALEVDLAAVRSVVYRASEAIYNATMYDPAGEKIELGRDA